MTLPLPKVCQRIRKLHALMGSANTEEAQNAHAQLLKLLANHGLTWNDLPTIIADTKGPSINNLDISLSARWVFWAW
jgi:hypothetical protein